MFTIRTATLSDLDTITDLEALCFPPAEAATKERFHERLTYFKDHFYLLESEGHLIAFINGLVSEDRDLQDVMYEDASKHNPDGSWQMIFGLDTHPDYRKQGHAGTLIRHLQEETRKAGRQGIVLTCKEYLLDYYSSFGFVNEGVSTSEHGGVQWYQMRWTIGN